VEGISFTGGKVVLLNLNPLWFLW